MLWYIYFRPTVPLTSSVLSSIWCVGFFTSTWVEMFVRRELSLSLFANRSLWPMANGAVILCKQTIENRRKQSQLECVLVFKKITEWIEMFTVRLSSPPLSFPLSLFPFQVPPFLIRPPPLSVPQIRPPQPCPRPDLRLSPQKRFRTRS